MTWGLVGVYNMVLGLANLWMFTTDGHPINLVVGVACLIGSAFCAMMAAS